MDSKFKVVCLNKTFLPQTLIYQAMHQDYCDKPVWSEAVPNEEGAGNIVVKRLLNGDRGHYGPLEHPQITFNCVNFPHSVMQQARTHRVGISFDVQSFRYTGQQVCKVAKGTLNVDDVFYLRPVGSYRDRAGKLYYYDEKLRDFDQQQCLEAAKVYTDRFELMGFSEEHLRGILPFDYRQHFVVSFNCRSLMHFLDLRFKKDAQLEIQQLCKLIYPHFKSWVPAIAKWYDRARLKKAKLAP